MDGDGVAASETGNTQVRGGPRGEMTQDQYDGKGMGNAQVGV